MTCEGCGSIGHESLRRLTPVFGIIVPMSLPPPQDNGSGPDLRRRATTTAQADGRHPQQGAENEEVMTMRTKHTPDQMRSIVVDVQSKVEEIRIHLDGIDETAVDPVRWVAIGMLLEQASSSSDATWTLMRGIPSVPLSDDEWRSVRGWERTRGVFMKIERRVEGEVFNLWPEGGESTKFPWARLSFCPTPSEARFVVRWSIRGPEPKTYPDVIDRFGDVHIGMDDLTSCCKCGKATNPETLIFRGKRRFYHPECDLAIEQEWRHETGSGFSHLRYNHVIIKFLSEDKRWSVCKCGSERKSATLLFDPSGIEAEIAASMPPCEPMTRACFEDARRELSLGKSCPECSEDLTGRECTHEGLYHRACWYRMHGYLIVYHSPFVCDARWTLRRISDGRILSFDELPTFEETEFSFSIPDEYLKGMISVGMLRVMMLRQAPTELGK